MDGLVEKALSCKGINRNVVALYVINTPRLTRTIPSNQITVVLKSLLTETGKKILNAIEQKGKSIGVQVEQKVVEGIPENEITKEVRKDDLIVMGCRPYRYLEKLLADNVCIRVFDHSSVMIMTYQIR